MARSFRVYNAILIVLVFLALFGLSRCFERVPLQTMDANPASSVPLPDRSFTTIDNRTIALKQFKGRPVLLHFWATWCPPCIKELPDLLQAAERNGTVVVIAISVDQNKDQITRFLHQIGKAQPLRNVFHVHDPGYTITVNGQRITSFPTTFILDRNLAVSSRINGPVDWRSYRF